MVADKNKNQNKKLTEDEDENYVIQEIRDHESN
jgi:hypothetical protein